MERPLDTSIASHLLAAINVLPPLRDEYLGNGEQHTPNRPAPLEPSTAQETYNSTLYQARAEETPEQQQDHAQVGNGESMHMDVAQQAHGEQSTEMQGEHAQTGENQDVEMTDQGVHDNGTDVGSAYPAILPSGHPVNPGQRAPTAVMQSSPMHDATMQAPMMQTPNNKATSRTTQTPGSTASKTNSSNRRVRRKWTEEETNDLIKGCHVHGVGNWKKVLDDPRFHFNGRSSVDLKDRFRTCFPKEYRKSTTLAAESEEGSEGEFNKNDTPKPKGPNVRKVTKTELHHAEVLEKLGVGGNFPKVQRRERREFTQAEDERLLQGFQLYGASWSKIQTDAKLGLGHRRSTDLRDRFRNAFPERYELAGFKARPRQRPKAARSPTEEDDKSVERDSVVDPSLENHSKADSAALLMQSILGNDGPSSWAGPDSGAPADQAPAPGSLALDPALNAGFEGSTLEQITEDFLAVAQGGAKDGQAGGEQQGPNDLVRWEDMATHPIFELEPSMTSSGAQGVSVESRKSPPPTPSAKKRAAEEDPEVMQDIKRVRTPNAE